MAVAAAAPEPEADPWGGYGGRGFSVSYGGRYGGGYRSGYGGRYSGGYGRWKRSADPEPVAEASADAEPWGGFRRGGYSSFGGGYGGGYRSGYGGGYRGGFSRYGRGYGYGK